MMTKPELLHKMFFYIALFDSLKYDYDTLA